MPLRYTLKPLQGQGYCEAFACRGEAGDDLGREHDQGDGKRDSQGTAPDRIIVG